MTFTGHVILTVPYRPVIKASYFSKLVQGVQAEDVKRTFVKTGATSCVCTSEPTVLMMLTNKLMHVG